MHAQHESGRIVLSGDPLPELVALDYEQARTLRNELGSALLDFVCAEALSRSDEPAPITQVSRGTEVMIALERADAEELGLIVSDELGAFRVFAGSLGELFSDYDLTMIDRMKLQLDMEFFGFAAIEAEGRKGTRIDPIRVRFDRLRGNYELME